MNHVALQFEETMAQAILALKSPFDFKNPANLAFAATELHENLALKDRCLFKS